MHIVAQMWSNVYIHLSDTSITAGLGFNYFYSCSSFETTGNVLSLSNERQVGLFFKIKNSHEPKINY